MEDIVSSFITRALGGNNKNAKIPQNEYVPECALVTLDRSGVPLLDGMIRFQNTPREIRDSKSAQFDSKSVLGRSEPLRAYVGSDSRTISFDLNYYWYHYEHSGIGSWDDIRSNVDKLKALAYPQYYESIASMGYSPPPKVQFYFGRIFRGVPCIVKGLSVVYKDPWVNPSHAQAVKGLSPQRMNSIIVSGNEGMVVPFHTEVSVQLEVAYDYDDARGSEDIKYGYDNTRRAKTLREQIISGIISRVGRMV
jgi:hypothetical protein